MMRKLSHFLVLMNLLTLSTTIYAESPAATSEHREPIIYYAGISGGIERMVGRRSEGLSEPNGAGGFVQTDYTVAKNILENNGTISVMAGFLWKFPPLPLVMGLEGYFGRGNNLSNVTDLRLDLGGATRYYSTDLQRKFYYGVLARFGHFFCKDILGYFSIGFDRSQFLTKRVLTNQPPISSNLITRTQGYNGVLLGVGVEKHIGHLVVGLELRNIQYRRKVTSDSVLVTNGTGTMNISFRPILYSALIRFGYRF